MRDTHQYGAREPLLRKIYVKWVLATSSQIMGVSHLIPSKFFGKPPEIKSATSPGLKCKLWSNTKAFEDLLGGYEEHAVRAQRTCTSKRVITANAIDATLCDSPQRVCAVVARLKFMSCIVSSLFHRSLNMLIRFMNGSSLPLARHHRTDAEWHCIAIELSCLQPSRNIST